MEKLLNVENEWEGIVVADNVEGPSDRISYEREVREAINESKTGKASNGPSRGQASINCCSPGSQRN